MSDVLDTPVQTDPAATHRPHETTFEGTRLASKIFDFDMPVDTPPAAIDQPKTDAPTVESVKPVTETKVLDNQPPPVNEWFKNYGWETEDAAKAEIEKVKNFQPTEAEIKFENEQSKQIHELIRQGKTKEVKEFLVMQERLEGYTNGDVSKENADEIIKLGMQLKYKDLTPAEINYKFNKEYGIPSEPVQTDLETDDEFAAKKAQWQAQVNDIEMNKVIEAKLMRPELETAKSKLVLPDILGIDANTQKPPTQEELEAAKRYDESFANSVEQSVKDFNGFSVSVKNEDVGLPEISIAYSVVDAEKSSLSKELKDWVKTGYDANALFAQRWVNKDGSINTKLLAEDRYWLNNREQIVQKMAQEASTKAIEAFVKGKKNITIKEAGGADTPIQADQKTDLDKIRDVIFQ